MKILYIGNYRDSSSAGRVSRDYLLALIEAGADIAARPLIYGQPSLKTVDTRILKAEAKASKGATICVQHVPYTHLLSDSRFDKNVGIIGFNYKPPRKELTDITRNVEQFDDIICLNRMTQLITGKLGDVSYAHPISIKKTDDKVSTTPGNYVFYFIGKMSQRKNVDCVISAFHREFARDEPVDLLIKTSCDIDPKIALNIINAHINNLKQKAGRYTNLDKYKKEIVTVTNLLDENWGIIHNTGDCLVMPSYGEYTPLIPSLALAYGNEVIINNTIGLGDLEDKRISLCESSHIYTQDSKAANLTNYESKPNASWYEASVCDLQQRMRSVFEMHNKKEPTPTDEWSFKTVGEQLLGRILK